MINRNDYALCSRTVSVENFSSTDLTNAYAWLRDQTDECDERLDEQGANRTQHCLRSADGVYRSPLSVLIERGESEESVDENDGTIDTVDAFEVTGGDLDETDDEYSRMAERQQDDLAIDCDEDLADRADVEERPAPPRRSKTFSSLIRCFSTGRIIGKVIFLKDNRRRCRNNISWKSATTAKSQRLRHKTGATRLHLN